MDLYDIVEELGNGGHGDAILVKHKVTQELRVAKIMKLDARDTMDEGKLLSVLNHPNIIRFLEQISDPNTRSRWMIMEYAEAGDLAQYITQYKEKNEFIPESEIIRIFIQLCSALLYLHEKNILHRDLKPHNIFMTSQGYIKLGDFGIAKALQNTLDVAHTQIGTPLYLSPEVCEGMDYDTKSDIWGLGCILYELLALQSPFQSKSMAQIVIKIVQSEPNPLPTHYDPKLLDLVALLLSKTPQARPSVADILGQPFIRTYMLRFMSYVPRNPLPFDSKPSTMKECQVDTIQCSLIDFVPSRPTPQDIVSDRNAPDINLEDEARQQFLINQRAARLYKERMDQLKNAPSPFVEESPRPVSTCTSYNATQHDNQQPPST